MDEEEVKIEQVPVNNVMKPIKINSVMCEESLAASNNFLNGNMSVHPVDNTK